MLTLERQNEILETLKNEKTTTVKSLAAKLFVSEATIRRDLTEMERQNLVRRAHGGAVLTESEITDPSIAFRMTLNEKEKVKIANLSAPLLAGAKSVFMDSSSTAQTLAVALKDVRATFVTTGIQTALELNKRGSGNVILTGGTVSYSANTVSGTMALTMLRDFNFDVAVTSCSGIDENFFATEKTVENRDVKRQVMAQAKVKILLV
ncbi:MAG: DeoR/GlpR family DNA-binding transcription regulator, partial [Clostridia bacterium]|nr:DeoR/GlpR family DNA-binding transcription regulator [Clostridia bacterium]